LARIIAITNQKGGVGKTTTAINLAAALAASEAKVLLIDCDPQGNATSGLGTQKIEGLQTTYNVLIDRLEIREAICHTEMDGLDLLPADKNLIGVNLELVNTDDRESVLRRRLERIKLDYEYILIDCPPALDLLTLNALMAADAVLVPIEGILLTLYDERTNLTKQVAADLREFFGSQVFQTTIPRSVKLAEAPSHGKPILLYDPSSRGSDAYIQLAKEILSNDQKRSTQSAG
jgi:chromosome partitioning protein